MKIGILGSGRITSEDNFTHYRKPELDESAAPVPEDDFIAVADAAKHYCSVDPLGGLAWEMNSISYFDTTAHVLQILSGKASNAYKDYLRRNSVSRSIGGKDALDLEEAVRKISSVFEVGEIMLNGGVRPELVVHPSGSVERGEHRPHASRGWQEGRTDLVRGGCHSRAVRLQPFST